MALPNSLKHRDISRRSLLLGAAAAGISAALLPRTSAAADVVVAASGEIRPFKVEVSEAALTDLRRRLTETRWPDGETVMDRSQGVQPDRLKELVRYWQSSYDWRKAESRLNSFPQFLTNIDGLDIHFIHVRSRHENALPLIMTHGWPGSVFELLDVIGPLTDPTAHGGRADEAAWL
ncbi:hypothetical protein ACVIGV_000645 [Rhizobium leguminosarum]